jgi:hypothetical protein
VCAWLQVDVQDCGAEIAVIPVQALDFRVRASEPPVPSFGDHASVFDEYGPD